MKIKLTSVMVNNQDKALKFYTEVLGFAKKTEIPIALKNGWLLFFRTLNRIKDETPD